MGFRTPSEITRELDQFDKRKESEAEGQKRLFGKKESSNKEILSLPNNLHRIGAYVTDLILIGIVLALPSIFYSHLVMKILANYLSAPVPQLVEQQQNLNQMSPEELDEFMASAQSIADHAMQIAFFSSLMWILFYGVAYTLWFGFFHSTYGGSPGKLIFNLEVRDDFDETRTGYMRAFFREFIGKSISGFLFLIGFVMGLFTHERRALHDFLTGTKVVRVDRTESKPARSSSSPSQP